MIRLYVFLAALAVALLLWAAMARRSSTASPSAGSGDIRQQFPDRDENDSASRLLATVARLDERELRRQREAAIDYIRREVASSGTASAPPPHELSTFLSKHAAELLTIRAQLASNPPPVWKLRADDLDDPPQPDLITASQLFTNLAADALSAHSAHRDAAAWSDLGAMWVLARSLWIRPDIPSVLTALTGSRMIAAIAARLPPPPPRWWSDYVSFDPKPPVARAVQYEAWALRARAERYPIGPPDEDSSLVEAVRRAAEPFVRPIRVVQADERARPLRELTQAIARTEPCSEFPAAATTRNWTSTMQRLNRFIIEREGAAKLLAAAERRRTSGEWPAQIDERSACSRARWKYQRTPDGIELSFTGQLPLPQTRIVTPLAYRR